MARYSQRTGGARSGKGEARQKMRMRSIFSVVLVSLIAAGCGNSSSGETTTAAPATTTPTTQPPAPRYTNEPDDA